MTPDVKYVILASDGLWEFMTNQEILDITAACRREGGGCEDAVQRLLGASRKRWLEQEPVIDDTTIIVAYL